jgi:CubicO group peptidase (beta-lactamase class C family)
MSLEYDTLPDALAGARALRSTVHDLLRFLAVNITPLGSPVAAGLRYAARLHFQTDVPARSAGLAWQRLVTASGDTLVTHGGTTAGYAAFMGFDARRRVAVVVLSNSGSSVDDIGVRLLDPTTARDADIRTP